VLKYNGGKWLMAPWIIQHFPKHRVYVELFGGGGSVLLRKPRSRFEYYNDFDSAVVNFFQVLRDQPLKLIRAVRFTPYAELEHELSKEPTTDPVEWARRFYINCWMSMVQNKSGGSFRVRGNLADRGSKTGRYIPAKLWADLEPWRIAAERFSGVHIINRDFADLIPRTDQPDTLFYVDPPYLLETRSGTDLYDCEFSSVADHERLLKELAKVQGMVILSGYRNDLYDATGWQRVELKVRDNKRNEKTECLWLNPACQKALGQQDLFPALGLTVAQKIKHQSGIRYK
jgi:DNA adenine methylase